MPFGNGGSAVTPRVHSKSVRFVPATKSPLCRSSTTDEASDSDATPRVVRAGRPRMLVKCGAIPRPRFVHQKIAEQSSEGSNEWEEKARLMASSQTRLQQILAATRNDLARARQQIQEKDDMIVSMVKSQEAAEQKQRRQSENFKRHYDQTSHQISQLRSEIERLQGVAANADKTSEHLEAAIAERDKIYSKLTDLRSKAKECLDSQQAKLELFEKENAALREQLHEATIKIETFQNGQSNRMIPEEIEKRLEKYQAERQASKEALKKALQVLREREDEHQRLEALEAQLAMKDRQIAQLETDQHQQMLMAKKQSDLLRNSIDIMQQKMDRLAQENAQLRRMLGMAPQPIL